MSKQDIIENEVDNSINPPPPPAQEGYIQGNIGYNCSECSSLIEILSIKENNLEFNCVNTDKHNNKLNINNYLEKMKKYIDNKNLNNKCEKHNHKYRLFCLDCKCHLCKECILSKIHKTHNRVILGEEQPNKEDIKLINDKIKYYNNKIQNIKENQIKELKIE